MSEVVSCHVSKHKTKTFHRKHQKSPKIPVKTFTVAPLDTRYQLWEIRSIKEGQKMFLKSLQTKGAINITEERQNCWNILVEVNRVLQIEKLLRDRDILFDITGAAVSSAQPIPPIAYNQRQRVSNMHYRAIRSPLKKLVWASTERAIDWTDYYPLHAIYAFMDQLEQEFPSICTVVAFGKTCEGRDIKVLKVSNGDAKNTGVWIDGTIHAREWISTSVVTYIADNIVRNFGKSPKFVTNKDWYFVPVLNPDGYIYSHEGDRMWRKNRARYNGVVTGVDLNRNFGTGFSRIGGDGASDDPKHINFRGSEPFSEPETAAMKDFLLYSLQPFKIFLTFHSFSEVIAFPWCDSSEPCPDYVTLLEGATKMAKAIYQSTGRMYKVGGFKDIMYYAAGTSIDWSYGIARIPFSYLVELRSKEHKFVLPKSEIKDCCAEALSGIMALAEFVDQHTCLNCTLFSKKFR